MNTATKVLIALVAVVAVVAVGIFLLGIAAIPTSREVRILTSTTSSTASAIPSSTTRNVQAILDHSAGYIFSGDGVSGTTINVNKGDTVVITATSNQPPHDHGIAIDAYGINQLVAQPNTVIQFVANQAGTFQIYCETCNEGPLGAHPWMTGTLVVNG